MPFSLLAVQKETLAWFLGNTFALAAWWVISGFLSGVFLSMFGGVVSFMLTGRVESQLQVQRFLGVVGGALIGMSGGATVGAIGEFSGVVGMVYLWGFVGMMLAAFQGATEHGVGRLDEDDPLGMVDNGIDNQSFVSQVLAACSRLGQRKRSPDEFMGLVLGGLFGVFYGVFTGLVVPLHATAPPGEELGTTIMRAAAVWAVLGGFGGWVSASRCGIHAGMTVLVIGLVFGSSLGGIVAMVGELFGDVVIGAMNGAIGGAFFGSIAAHELIHKRFP